MVTMHHSHYFPKNYTKIAIFRKGTKFCTKITIFYIEIRSTGKETSKKNTRHDIYFDNIPVHNYFCTNKQVPTSKYQQEPKTMTSTPTNTNTTGSRRISLRRWRESDASELYLLTRDPEIDPRAGWPPHQSEKESLDAIRKYFTNETTWAVILKETGAIIGCAGYHLPKTANLPLKEDEAEVGYWIARPYWNQGLCTEALSMVIGHCRKLGTITILFGEHFTDNPASGRVMGEMWIHRHRRTQKKPFPPGRSRKGGKGPHTEPAAIRGKETDA